MIRSKDKCIHDKILQTYKTKLLTENKFSRYLLYALGEILLVVIGILIALKVNNWNVEQIAIREEKIILEKLRDEFLLVEQSVSETKEFFKSGLDGSIQIALMCGENVPSYSDMLVDSLINLSFNYSPIVISQPHYEELINSDKLSKLSDEALRLALYQWKQELPHTQVQSKLLSEWTRTEITVYLFRHGSNKNLDVLLGVPGFTKRSSLFKSYDPIFKSLEFENLVQNKIFFLNNCIIGLNNLQLLSHEIAGIIDPVDN